jgi:uncharacterized membrane protein YhiD involved in acid resistance
MSAKEKIRYWLASAIATSLAGLLVFMFIFIAWFSLSRAAVRLRNYSEGRKKEERKEERILKVRKKEKKEELKKKWILKKKKKEMKPTKEVIKRGKII